MRHGGNEQTRRATATIIIRWRTQRKENWLASVACRTEGIDPEGSRQSGGTKKRRVEGNEHVIRKRQDDPEGASVERTELAVYHLQEARLVGKQRGAWLAGSGQLERAHVPFVGRTVMDTSAGPLGSHGA